MYIIQHDYRDDLTHANIINVSKRNCRIGRVTRKAIWPFKPPLPAPLDMYRYRKPAHDVSDPCAQCVGKICGNVACPKRAFVTC